ncbi:MAG: hypothetical protein AB1483_05595 [Candidatus Zixiibacteriota bacterium]
MPTADRFMLASYIETQSDIQNIIRLFDSLNEFGGGFKGTPISIYYPDHASIDSDSLKKLDGIGIESTACAVPAQARKLFYAGKVYAAGEAEAEAERRKSVLIWMDEDTIILSEPDDFSFAPDIKLAYVPVMHNRSGSLYGAPPDDFWGRIYTLLGLTDDMLFPMVTPADQQTIRAYFHCGLAVVRPQCGILRRWVKDFEKLCRDEALAEMCASDRTKNVFLHQTALTGAVLNSINRDEMRQLPESYNYPVFFEKQYGAVRPFDSIENVVTLRCVVSSENMGEDWPTRLKGPQDKIDWLKERIR